MHFRRSIHTSRYSFRISSITVHDMGKIEKNATLFFILSDLVMLMTAVEHNR
jgi:hypothetical protein